MKYKYVFFDRDGVLTRSKPETEAWKKAEIEGWSGREYRMDYDRMMRLFTAAGYPKTGLKSVEEEITFWLRYWVCLLREEGVTDLPEEKAWILHRGTWLRGHMLWPDTIDALEYFRNHGYRMGVISDTSPSLELTLRAVGIADYFESFTCSSLVGAMKPDERIYRAALHTLGAAEEESLYVDDYEPEADGARALGLTAFHLVRSGPCTSRWDIPGLQSMVDYAERNG
ncbi:MAG: HAD family hydrolase [Clostridiaceae bacterium]|nr:HAD family hydrolase [Clostridiaceae bacterium]